MKRDQDISIIQSLQERLDNFSLLDEKSHETPLSVSLLLVEETKKDTFIKHKEHRVFSIIAISLAILDKFEGIS